MTHAWILIINCHSAIFTPIRSQVVHRSGLCLSSWFNSIHCPWHRPELGPHPSWSWWSWHPPLPRPLPPWNSVYYLINPNLQTCADHLVKRNERIKNKKCKLNNYPGQKPQPSQNNTTKHYPGPRPKTVSSDHEAEDQVQQMSLAAHWNVMCYIGTDPIFRFVMRPHS